VAAALAAGLVSCRRSEPPEKTPPAGEVWLTDGQIQGARLVIETAATRPMSLHLVTAGRVAFDESRVAHVFSPVSGRITRVLGGLGQKVRRGDALAVVESPDLAAAWSDLVKARADVVAADHELERQKNLYAHHASAERDLETAQDNSEKSRAELARARLRMQTLHAPDTGEATQEFQVRSPIDGFVVNRNATPGLEIQGMLSQANVVQELFTVGETDPVWVWGDVYERDLGKVRRGQKVSITSVAYPGRVVAGTVDYVGQALDPQTRTSRVRCVVANPDGALKPEMFVSLLIELDRRDMLAVQRSAALRSGDRQIVYVQDGRTEDGRTRFRERSVALGEGDDGWVAVVSGLQPGERVVVSGSILLSGVGE
jgi:cobalt-zinc-cadmium efflux system membrane fusion protein